MSAEDADGTGGATARILVVDDDAQVCKITELMLRQLGYEVLTAGSGRKALETADEEEGRLDLVLMDLTMPAMSGAQTFEEMRRRHPQTKVLFASGYQEEESAELSRGEGVVGFLQKPFELETLAQKVREGLAAE